MTHPAPDPATVQADLDLVTGGRFNVDHIGPQAYAAVVARVRAHPDAYLAAAEERWFGGRFDALEQSRIAAPALLRLVKDAGPPARAFGEALMRHYDAALLIADRATSRPALAQVLDEDTANTLSRLDDRRRAVRALLTEMEG